MNAARHFLPHENFVYLADTKNSPYGNKSKKQIARLVLSLVRLATNTFSPKAVVLACNTATAAAINQVRKTYPDLIVAGVEPAIKPSTGNPDGSILVLTTHATLKHCRLLKKYKRLKLNHITYIALPQLAGLIDNNLSNLPAIQPEINKMLLKYRHKVTAVVIGCTHFNFVTEQINQALGGGIVFYDNCRGTAKRLKFCLTKKKLLSTKKTSGKTVIYTTDYKFKTTLEYARFLTTPPTPS